MTNQINNQSLIAWNDVIQLTLTLKMTAAQIVETSVTVNNSSIQDYVHLNDQTQPTNDKSLHGVESIPLKNFFRLGFT